MGSLRADTKDRWNKELQGGSEVRERVLPTLGRGPLTCTAAGGTAAPNPPGLPSSCRSRYRAQSPTLGSRTRAARASATACKSRFSLRLIGAGPPRRACPRLCASARPPVRPSARRRQQFGQQKRPRRRPRSNSAALPLLAGGGAGRLHCVTAVGVRSNPIIPWHFIPRPAPRLPPRDARLSPMRLHRSIFHLLIEQLRHPGCKRAPAPDCYPPVGSNGASSFSAAPRPLQLCQSPGVRELGAHWGRGARDRGRPGELARLSASSHPARAPGLRGHATTYCDSSRFCPGTC